MTLGCDVDLTWKARNMDSPDTREDDGYWGTKDPHLENTTGEKHGQDQHESDEDRLVTRILTRVQMTQKAQCRHMTVERRCRCAGGDRKTS